MMRLFTALLLLSFSFPVIAQTKKPFDEKQLSIEWQLQTNQYQGAFQALNKLFLTNTSKRPFPAKGWTIYFSSARPGVTSPVSGNLLCEHVNGDIYRIRPTEGFAGINPGKTVQTEYLSLGNSLNKSAMPSGMYLVWDTDPNKGWALINLKRGPFLDSTQQYRTPAVTFAKNAAFSEVEPANLPPVFPTPKQFEPASASFKLDKDVAILASEAFKEEAALLAADIKTLIGATPVVATAFIKATRSISLQQKNLPEEAYTIEISADQVTIAAKSGAGIFYGIQSLKTMLPAAAFLKPQPSVTIPAFNIADAPRFGFRSLMLDIGRNFQTKTELLRVIELMGLYKLNALHLHFNEDEGWRVEMPSLPELTEVGAVRGHPLDSKKNLPASFGAGSDTGKFPGSGFYSRVEFIEILRFAKARHISVIPEIETPGHARAAIKSMDARYEKYKAAGNLGEAEKYLLSDPDDASVYSTAQAWTDNVICVARPSVYAFIERVVDDIVDMYREAGAPLSTIHMGGDEVPDGAWEKSPICNDLIKRDSSLQETNDLWYYYFGKVAAILRKKNLDLSGWEEVGMRKTKLLGAKKLIVNPKLANEGFRLNVWNNMVGWGNEDLPYRLANAGYKVILSPVSNNYFDMSYYKDPEEPGFYWGGFVDLDKPFYFIPFDYYKNTRENAAGDPIQPGVMLGRDQLTDFGKSNILGLQGLVWSETLRSAADLENILLPKMLGMAERAWAADPAWAQENDTAALNRGYAKAWNIFATIIGKNELPRLTGYNGGYGYRIPVPGVMLSNGAVLANMQLPGFEMRYTSDGKEPDTKDKLYTGAITEKGTIRIRAFNAAGRGSRSVSVTH